MEEKTAIRRPSRGGPRRVLILVEEWRHEAPKLLAAYEVLWHTARVSPAAGGLGDGL